MTSDITFSWVAAIAPEICLLILLVIVLAYDRFLKPEERRKVGLLTAWGAFVTLIVTASLWYFWGQPDVNASQAESLVWGNMLRFDMVSLGFTIMFLIALMITSLVSMDVPRLQRSEYYMLLISATMGFCLMAASADLIMIYVALETASISSYVLAGFFTDSKRSSEAGMKYFVYGAFATGIMLYGMSLLYGVTGQTNIYAISEIFARGELIEGVDTLLLVAAMMVIVGFGFKISAVPFHFWTPDVYEGAPTPFTGFVSTASKAAGFAVFLRVFMAGDFGNLAPYGSDTAFLGQLVWVILVTLCIITMTLGNFAAIYQKNIKRMLAYSSVAQAGYALVGLVTFSQDGSGATMFYLFMYLFTNIAAFAVIMLVSNVSGAETMQEFNGLSRRSPYLALVMMFAVLSLGGIPPTAGFFGKFFLFRAAVDSDLWWLALIGVLNAFVALYYYLGIIKHMYLYRPDDEEVSIPVSRAAMIGLAVTTIFIFYLGIYAGPAFEWTRTAAAAFFPG